MLGVSGEIVYSSSSDESFGLPVMTRTVAVVAATDAFVIDCRERITALLLEEDPSLGATVDGGSRSRSSMLTLGKTTSALSG